MWITLRLRDRSAARKLQALFLSGATFWLAGAPPAEAQSNVLMIISGDLNRMISPLGDPNAITPSLQRLAARSLCFENAICQFPFCSPSRASIFTGLYPWNHGNLGGGGQYPNHLAVFPDRVGLPEYFKNNGYWTASYGKTEHHIQNRNWDVRFTNSPAHNAANLVHSDNFLGSRGITGGPLLKVYDEPLNNFIDGLSATAALDDLANHLAAPDPSPFFVAVGFYKPHDPWDIPKSIFDQHDPAALTMNPNPRGNFPSWAWKINGKTLPLMSAERRRDLFRGYLSAVTLMDHHLGRLLDFLDANSLWESTVVLFLSDHGYSLYEHEAMYAKRNVTRENLSVPLLIHAPDGGAENAVCARQVELQDLFPTLVDLCGLPPYPGYLNGRSIKPLLLDPATPWPYVAKSVLASPTATFATAKIVQLGPLKVAEGRNTTQDMFFDHAADPCELSASWHPVESPPAPEWAPLIDALNNEFGFAVGQSRVFYHQYSVFAPDRDSDGADDSTELALGSLGFQPWFNDSPRWSQLMRGPLPISDGVGLLGYCLTVPGFSVNRPPGYEFVNTPMELQESEDLETWISSSATYEEDPDGSFRWKAAFGSYPQKFYRFLLPRL